MIKLKNKKKKKGFTLVELVAVIAIIGILAAVLVPNITGYIKEAKKVEVLEQARKVVTAYEALNVKNPTAATASLTKKVSELYSLTGGLLDDSMTDKLVADTTTVQHCLYILESDSYTFDLDGSNFLGDIIKLSDGTKVN